MGRYRRKAIGFFRDKKGRVRPITARGSGRRRKHGPRYRIPSKPRSYVKRDRLGRFKEWTDWRRGTLIDATRKAEHEETPGYGHMKDYDGRKRKTPEKPKPQKKRVPKKAEKKPKPKTEEPKKVEKKTHVKIPRKKRARPKKMTHIERMHLLAACKKFGVDPQEIDSNISYYENKKHIQDLAKMRGYSKAEVTSSEQEARAVSSQYAQYLSSLRSELESAGYTVSGPEM